MAQNYQMSPKVFMQQLIKKNFIKTIHHSCNLVQPLFLQKNYFLKGSRNYFLEISFQCYTLIKMQLGFQ